MSLAYNLMQFHYISKAVKHRC